MLNILYRLSPKLIIWSNKFDCEEILNRFEEESNFPGVIGAIDGYHFTVKLPSDQQDSYTNKKFNKSIIMQGICTADKIFINVNVEFPGRLHDARIFVNSQVYNIVDEKGQEALFYSNKYDLLGDSAYPNYGWLIAPFKDYGNLNGRYRHFNYTLSRARVCIEHALSLLKGRWRHLLYINTTDIKIALKIILAYSVLHSFCLLKYDDYLEVVFELFIKLIKIKNLQEIGFKFYLEI